jgi:secondary thiamine-phosphate synthase enzyme
MIYTERIQLSTQGDSQVIDINEQVRQIVEKSRIHAGLACVFVVGSTGAITTTESEPGLLNHDLKAFFEKLAPADGYYKHEETWHDDNGHSHVRASALGPSVTIPLVDGRLTLGTWQQIVVIDFDTRPRRREVVVQVMGE